MSESDQTRNARSLPPESSSQVAGLASKVTHTGAEDPGDPSDDPRIMQCVREFMTALEAGQHPDREEYGRRLPELAAELDECLQGAELAFAMSRQASVPEHPPGQGMPLGDFRILREIGRGGMGTVYEAEQLSLGRLVALKVLPFAASLDTRNLARFRLEAQAAAQLHHPHIVPVYAVGSDRGTHYYAMQLINGRPVSELLRDAQRDQIRQTNNATGIPAAGAEPSSGNPHPSGPGGLTHTAAGIHTKVASQTRSLSGTPRVRFRMAAELISQVADALEFAHASGVIHRDVKPGNLLLDHNGHIWVTDFGLAHVASGVQVTQSGDLLGTLRYMSPEQAAGRRTVVDHRTDVYSLGATLYEMLCLKPMFDGPDRQALLNQILNSEPSAPRQIDPRIPVELETIVLKAIAKAPAERYASAGDFAEDLRRFLAERPVLARRPTLVDRIRKWMRRHPTVVGSVLVTLTIGVIGLTAAVAAISHQKSLTSAALEREKLRAEEAESQFRLAQQAADEMIAVAEEDLSNDPVQEGLRQRLLESALTFYQSFIDERQDDGQDVAALAQTRDRVQRLLADLDVLHADRDAMLLREPDVRTDLRLTAEQEEQILKILQHYDSRRRNGSFRNQGPPPERPEGTVLEIARQSNQHIAETLNEHQQTRLHQIALQFQGPRVFRDSEVISHLQLTGEQRQQIRQMEVHTMFGRDPFPPRNGRPDGPGPPHDRNSPGPRFGPQQSEIIPRVPEEILMRLTPHQRELWLQLVGPPFEGQLHYIRPNRPAPPRG
ncbi:MAG: serine/threonine protein kinase [Planctomycetaceae bacterium]|nr:serine/threonine protein kinase [Planctomycetaceae bacterium]